MLEHLLLAEARLLALLRLALHGRDHLQALVPDAPVDAEVGRLAGLPALGVADAAEERAVEVEEGR